MYNRLDYSDICAEPRQELQPQTLQIMVDNTNLSPVGAKMPARVKIDFRHVLNDAGGRIRPETLKLFHLRSDGSVEPEAVPVRFDDPDPKPDSFFYDFLGGGGQNGDLVFQHRVDAETLSHYRLEFQPWHAGDGPVQPSPTPQIGDYDILRYDKGAPMSGVFQTKIDVVDWFGDGKLDIITSDGLGHVILYRRLGKDPFTFAPPEPLTVDGKPLKMDYMTAVDAVDWKGRGKLDLIVADETSNLWYVENIGTRTNPKLAPPVPLLDSDGRQIRSPAAPCKELNFFKKDYAPVPCVVDYFGHGKNDLVLGGYITGQFFLYENIAQARPASRPQITRRDSRRRWTTDRCDMGGFSNLR